MTNLAIYRSVVHYDDDIPRFRRRSYVRLWSYHALSQPVLGNKNATKPNLKSVLKCFWKINHFTDWSNLVATRSFWAVLHRLRRQWTSRNSLILHCLYYCNLTSNSYGHITIIDIHVFSWLFSIRLDRCDRACLLSVVIILRIRYRQGRYM